jgi:hypothetical protein
MLIRFQRNGFQQEGKHYSLSCTNILSWLPHRWRDSCPTYSQKEWWSDYSNYRGKSLLSVSNKIVSNIILSRLIPFADQITGNQQCRFRRNMSETDQIFYIRHMPEKQCENNGIQYITYIMHLPITPMIQLGGKYIQYCHWVSNTQETGGAN